jgi:small subunit ribosomal protein S1
VKVEHKEDDEYIVEGTIVARAKKGLLVAVRDGIDAYLPGSQVDLRPVRDLNAFIGQRHRFRIIKFRKGASMVLSRRVLLERERAELKEQTLSKLVVGHTIEGIVVRITDYGAFVDIGGIDGLIRFDGQAEGRPDASIPLRVGDRLCVVVLSFDSETERIVLALAPKSPIEGGPAGGQP